MAKNDRTQQALPPESVISIIGVGMTLTGDCETDGALRIEGTVNGNVRAGKSVVIGKEGLVDGNIYTQDAIISGRVLGSVHAHSRLEVQSTSQISGEIQARRMQLEEGASVEGQVSVGEAAPVETTARPKATAAGQPSGPNVAPRTPTPSTPTGDPNPSSRGLPAQAASPGTSQAGTTPAVARPGNALPPTRLA